MAWIIEDLAGDKNGTNKTFTMANAPISGSQTVIWSGWRQREVGSQPGNGQYARSGTTITLGNAPASGEDLWSRAYIAD